MSERRFKFVSPGIFLKEIDQSQLPDEATPIGPVVIGRAQRGPAMRPIQVNSYSEFVQVFGEPYSQESVNDPWRDGNKGGTTYGAYAAKAWLRNSPTLTFIRLLGKQSPNAADNATRAGWNTTEALGLWVFGSSSTGGTLGHTGCLAAIFHRTDTGITMGLSGNFLDTSTATYGNAAAIKAESGTSATNAEFRILIEGEVARASDASTEGNYVFNFDPNSKNFIRNVFNTDAAKTNSTLISDTSTEYKKYFLAETFEYSLEDLSGDSYFGVMAELKCTGSGQTEDGNDFRYPSQRAETGWYIAQDLNTATASYNAENMPKLFKLRQRDGGIWGQNNLKVSIGNMRYGRISGSYGSFDVIVRKISDSDNVPVVVERFSNCNLDQSSANYIARKIGDKYVSYDSVKLLNKEVGQYDNKSQFFYVKVNDSVAAGTAKPEYLPFGVFGPLRYEHAKFMSGSSFQDVNGTLIIPFIAGSGSVSNPATASGGDAFYVGDAIGCLFNFPEVPVRTAGTDGSSFEPSNAYYGAYTGRTAASGLYAQDISDLVKSRPRGFLTDPNSDDNEAAETQSGSVGLTEWSWVFSLDNVSASFVGNRVSASAYATTYRSTGASVTSKSDSSWKTLIDKGIAQFTTVLAGGSTGFAINEKEPALREGLLETSANAPYNTITRAIDLLQDPENIAMNIATVPGLKTAGLTKRLIDRCENRGDSLAIIDVESAFVSPGDRTATENAAPTANATLGDATTAVSSFTDRQLDSSYGCAYYPWVQSLDDDTNKVVYLPPSVVALGVMSKTDSERGPWFAPAGFNRGGLSDGDAGIAVLNTTEKLSSKDRDNLYDVGINPIASFPNEGVVIFGQKTLQADRSALDRINVRRMLIYVKAGISSIATGFLFEPNVSDTWNRFKAEAIPFLTSVQQQYGIDEYKLVLDETTTTPDLIDQNILYAKLFIKPTRAIEFIAVDFFITNSGAAFED
tara:strand:- start:2353 stop:5253 length:2901 start_codon:yes stop_codon:yes gene_type:complete